MPDACEHRYAYAGVRYRDSRNPLPGTGACRRLYGHVYFYERCRERKTDMIDDPSYGGRPEYTTYEKPRWGATPAGPGEVPLPAHERTLY